mmetsp:Transcript_26113/g.59045  ORF Transcript_26113/g.59045 Transcript_26113/m.59045 type:complete len:241 (-) Transcript_26113:528-1250(-)
MAPSIFALARITMSGSMGVSTFSLSISSFPTLARLAASTPAKIMAAGLVSTAHRSVTNWALVASSSRSMRCKAASRATKACSARSRNSAGTLSGWHSSDLLLYCDLKVSRETSPLTANAPKGSAAPNTLLRKASSSSTSPPSSCSFLLTTARPFTLSTVPPAANTKSRSLGSPGRWGLSNCRLVPLSSSTLKRPTEATARYCPTTSPTAAEHPVKPGSCSAQRSLSSCSKASRSTSGNFL